MAIPAIAVATARKGWNWQWNQLMNGLAPADKKGSYQRPKSQYQKAIVLSSKDIETRSPKHLPHLIIGRSCPWAHRTWLTYELRNLHSNLNLIFASADHKAGRWLIEPSWMGSNSLRDLY